MWDLGLRGMSSEGVFPRDPSPYLRVFRRKSEKLRTARSISATEDRTRHLQSTSSSAEPLSHWWGPHLRFSKPLLVYFKKEDYVFSLYVHIFLANYKTDLNYIFILHYTPRKAKKDLKQTVSENHH